MEYLRIELVKAIPMSMGDDMRTRLGINSHSTTNGYQVSSNDYTTWFPEKNFQQRCFSIDNTEEDPIIDRVIKECKLNIEENDIYMEIYCNNGAVIKEYIPLGSVINKDCSLEDACLIIAKERIREYIDFLLLTAKNGLF